MGLSPHIIDFSQVYKVDEGLVGKKAYELGTLWKLNIPLPKGFVVTTQFYKDFLHATGIAEKIKKTQTLKHPALADSFRNLFAPIRKQIMHKPIPQALVLDLHKSYRQLSGIFKNQSLQVFSSCPNNKCLIFTNVKGDANLILKIKKIWSESPETLVAVVVQENISSKVKGKIYTNNPTLDKKLPREQENELINYCRAIQDQFYFPKEIEYAVDKGRIYITKMNPFTGTVSEAPKPRALNNNKQKLLIKGISVNPGIVTGPVKILHNKWSASQVKKGEIAILPNLDRSVFKKVKNAKAVIIDSILANSLNKTLYRKDFQIPTIEGVKNATHLFQNGSVVTVNGTNGEIYSGGLIH